MSSYKTSTDKKLRKEKKRMREILGLKSKPYDQLNEDQKAKLATEDTVNRRIQFLEKIISKRNNSTPIPVESQVERKVQKNKNKKKNKINNSELAAYKKHQQKAKIEREEQKNMNMSREIKVAYYRLIRRERKRQQEEYIGWMRMRKDLIKLIMKSEKAQETQETHAI